MPYTELNMALTEDQQALKEATHKFAVEVLRPASLELDKMTPEEVIAPGSIYWQTMKQMYELGYHAIHIPEELGGMGFDATSIHIVMEELAYGSAGFAISLGVSMFGPFMATMLGDETINENYIRPFAECRDASVIGCWGITEPIKGSDSLTTHTKEFNTPNVIQQVRATKSGDKWLLNGQKSAWVSNGTIATMGMIHVNCDPELGMAGGGIAIVDLTQKGVSRGRPLDKIGQRELPQGEIYFDNVEVPDEFMIIQGEGYENMCELIVAEANLHMGPMFTGVARAAYDMAVQYSRERVQGGKRLCDHSAVKQRLFRMFTKVETSRAYSRAAMTYNLCNVPPDAKYSFASKIHCTQSAFDITNEAVQLFGGYGLTKEYPIEKLFRDARASMIEDGSNDVLGITGANAIIKEIDDYE